MTAVNLNAWLDCNNEMDMDSFIQQFDNDRALAATLPDAYSQQTSFNKAIEAIKSQSPTP